MKGIIGKGVGSLEKQKVLAGVLLFLVGEIALLGIITAEALYPGYSTVQEISDLGATRPPNSVIHQPSATIFNLTMMVCGAILLFTTYLVYNIFEDRFFTGALGLFGLGILGVGLFPM